VSDTTHWTASTTLWSPAVGAPTAATITVAGSRHGHLARIAYAAGGGDEILAASHDHALDGALTTVLSREASR
jgi:hypothetical protein